jgi:hypothetical protein
MQVKPVQQFEHIPYNLIFTTKFNESFLITIISAFFMGLFEFFVGE